MFYLCEALDLFLSFVVSVVLLSVVVLESAVFYMTFNMFNHICAFFFTRYLCHYRIMRNM